jgi:hypothetical protein
MNVRLLFLEERRDATARHPERVAAYRQHLFRWAVAKKFKIAR